MARNGREYVEGLARGLSIIEAFGSGASEMTLSEISRATGHSPAATRRGILTLVELGYMRAIGKRFVLAPKVLTLGSAYFQSTHIEDALLPELRDFVSVFGDAASVSVLSGTSILYIAHVHASAGLRPVANIGVTYPAHATSMGRVLMAALPDSDVERFLEGPLEAITDATVTDPDALREILRQVRRDGFATAVDQLAYGVTSLAAPVRLATGETVAAVNSSGYTGRVTPDLLVTERLAALKSLAQRLATILQHNTALRGSLG